MNWKGFGRKLSWPNLGTIPTFSMRNWGKPRKTSVRIIGVRTEVRIEHLPNVSLGTCRYSDKLLVGLGVRLLHMRPIMDEVNGYFTGTELRTIEKSAVNKVYGQ
jgi:hypothetical protein